ncbi:hypothetical protein [Luteitalea pratensis]|nr:hypothetical protein [Luteitalea pratensis]
MAVLVPLVTVAALAIAGWLASGIVTVQSLAAPSRIGLLSPPQTIIVVLLPLLALAALVSRRDRRTSPAATHGEPAATHQGPAATRLATLAVLLAPIVLPWLPLPLPAALLVWTGPLALAWWFASVAYTYADAFRATWAALRLRPGFGGQVGERALPRLIWSPSRAPLAAAAITGMALVAAAWRMGPQHPKGDEPDYLIITQSLLLDHDLQIENNHARADYAIYHRAPLPPSYLARGTDGAIYSVHAPGLPALLVPGFAVAGYRGAVATLILIAMAGAWLAWWTAWQLTQDVVASWVGTLATVGSAPFFLHGAAIFPDAPASVFASLAVAVLVAAQGRPDRGARLPIVSTCAASLALGLLPWLHTRYAILSIGFGAAMCLQIAARRDWRALTAFMTPASLLAASWFGFFFVVYGTANPSAPYGAYTQMALAHLLPGLPGLLFDQQFGLLASAPVLMVVLVAMRRTLRETTPGTWWVALLVVSLALLYTCVVGAYRMWWGGLSAPARFLVPLILPLAPFIALGWHSLQTRASRHMVVAMLVTSLALTALLVYVDHGALAYNMRDGRARWARWVSPLIDLSGALPAAHRDAPPIVLRDALIWLIGFAVAWVLWRTLERRGRLTPLVPLVTLAALLPAASAMVWLCHGVGGLAPARSQVLYLARRASAPADVLIAITRPHVERTRTGFIVELDSRRAPSASDYTVLRLDTLPAGRYRLLTDVRAPGARFGVTLGDARTTRFIADLDASAGHASLAFDLALPVENVVVKGSREAAEGTGRTWVLADEVSPPPAVPPATRAHPMGGSVWLLPEADVYAEPGGVWLGGDADITLGLPSSLPMEVNLRAGAADVAVAWSATDNGEARLSAGETRTVTMVPRHGRLRLLTRGGFRPSQVSPGNKDQRYLGAWISAPR